MHAFVLVVALAAATGGGKPPQPAARHIDVDEDEVVEGTTARGDGDAILASKKRRFDSLIRLRESFRPELLKSADAL
jgi:hypothetical protein